MVITENELLQQIDTFCEQHEMSDTAFGMAALGDFSLVEDLRTRSRSPRLKTVRKIVEFMEKYTPKEK